MNKHKLSFNSALIQLAAAQLLPQVDSLGLSEAAEALLREASQGRHSDKSNALLERMAIYIDLGPLKIFDAHIEDKNKNDVALKYCILRQAHYPLLQQLFGVSRNEATRLRQHHKIQAPPTRPPRIEEADQDAIWRDWQAILVEYPDEIEQWIAMGSKWPQYTLATLYVACVVEPNAVGVN